MCKTNTILVFFIENENEKKNTIDKTNTCSQNIFARVHNPGIQNAFTKKKL